MLRSGAYGTQPATGCSSGWGTSIVDHFASSCTHKVPQYFSLDLSDKRASEGDALKDM